MKRLRDGLSYFSVFKEIAYSIEAKKFKINYLTKLSVLVFKFFIKINIQKLLPDKINIYFIEDKDFNDLRCSELVNHMYTQDRYVEKLKFSFWHMPFDYPSDHNLYHRLVAMVIFNGSSGHNLNSLRLVDWIDFKIIQYWDSPNIPLGVYNAMQTWKNAYPNNYIFLMTEGPKLLFVRIFRLNFLSHTYFVGILL